MERARDDEQAVTRKGKTRSHEVSKENSDPSPSRSRNAPLEAADGLVQVAVRKHAPHMLERGGSLGRARKSVARGSSKSAAAAQAAKQGKGLVAEVQQAVTFTVDSGLKGMPHQCQPNAQSNHAHADLNIVKNGKHAATVQVGVGSVRYARGKARTSRADQVVVGKDALAELRSNGDPAAARLTDRVQFEDVTAQPASEIEVGQVATETLTDMLNGRRAAPAQLVFNAAAKGGVKSAITAGVSELVFAAIDRVLCGTPVDTTVIKRTLKAAWDGFLQGSVQTYVVAQRYLDIAKDALDSQLLHGLSKCVVWAGALAEFLIAVAKDVLAWMKGELEFGELLRRAGAKAVEALGGAAGALIVLQLGSGLSGLLLTLAILGAAWVGSILARSLGEWMFPATPAAQPVPAVHS